MLFFFFNDTATTEIYTLSLHDALPIFETSDTEATLPTIFVDPSYVVTDHHEARGYSWDKPLVSISHAIEFFKKYNGQKDQKVQILVKTGAVNTAGPSSYLFDGNHLAELRTASIRPRDRKSVV